MGASWGCQTASHHGGLGGTSDAPHDAPMLLFDNLVKKLDMLSTSNIDIYQSTLEICINNLLNLFFFGSGPPPQPPTRDHPTPPPGNHTYAQYFQQNPTYLLTMFRLSFQSKAYSFNMKYTYI